MMGIILRDRREKIGKQRGGGNMAPEAEIGVMQPQAKECQEPPEAGRGEERFSPGAFRRSMALLAP